jgi:hypothetical protein
VTECLDKTAAVKIPATLLEGTRMDKQPARRGIRSAADTEPGHEPARAPRRRAAVIWIVVIALLAAAMVVLHLTGIVGANMNG